MSAPPKPDFQVIDTVEDLKSCPRGTVVLDLEGKPFKRGPAENGQDYWASGEIQLPALLLWHPSWFTSLT